MPKTESPNVRRLVLVRPADAGAGGVRRLILARKGDALLPAPPRRASRPPPRG